MTSTRSETRYYGKYRGTVFNPEDPMRMGRIMAVVPQVSGPKPLTTWAMPCIPFAGIQSGQWVVPPYDAGVWIEFEQGDPNYPIWTGGYWGSPAEPPALAQLAPASVNHMVMQTTLQNSVQISDLPGPTGGILIKTTAGALISMSEIGITISNGQGASIIMAGPTVTINAGALTVT